MTSISALIVVKNEELFIQECIERILPYVDEVIFVNNASTDRTGIVVDILKDPKIKYFEYPPTDNQSELRDFSLSKATGEWIWIVDADEWYSNEACEAIQRAVNEPGEAISFRVGYHQLSWRKGHRQANFEHYPDRLYRRDVIEGYSGLLPNDMLKVKREFYQFRPFLEYDNDLDASFGSTNYPMESKKQPILRDVKYYHLARTRGYNYEYNKWYRYNQIIHPQWTEDKLKETSRLNQWVSGLYSLEPIDIPFEIPEVHPKVSVVIPNFQYRDFVGKAIESCLSQTYPAHEIIVVDDGSHDDSVAVIAKYPVKLIQTQNHGVACARNEGAKNATGDYLLFLDADDEISPDYIEKCINNLDGVVYTDIQFIGNANFVNSQPDYTPEEMKKWQIVPSTCALIDRHIWELVGGFDNQEIYEDWGFWLRVSQQGFNFKHIKEPLFKYRKHGKSRIDYLDSQMITGFDQLKLRYGITREVDLNRMSEAKKIWEK